MSIQMKSIFVGLSILIGVCAHAAELKPAERPENYRPHANVLDNRVDLKPVLDIPMRHTYVTRGMDGIFYMTGTVSDGDKGKDFQNNDGVFLWKSSDLKEWKPVGQVWSIEKQGGDWQKQRNLNPENPEGPLVRGMIAPEIHFLKGNWWIAYSMNGNGTGLLKSLTDKPEGPYEDLGRITGGEGNPSIFEDFDGALYWVWGPGRIARMKEDLSGLAEPPRQLTFDRKDTSASRMPKLHYPESVSLFKTESDKRRYFLLVGSGDCRLGGYTRNTLIFGSESLFGPYGEDGLKGMELLAMHGGQSTVFDDGAGKWYATFYGADDKALFRDRPAILPMSFDGKRLRPVRFNPTVQTTRGPWRTKPPMIEDAIINDLMILNAPDGNYYLTGSMFGDQFRKHGIGVWKSPTLESRSVKPDNWQEFTPVTWADIPIIRELAADDPSILDFTDRRKTKLGTMWNAEIHYVKGTFWVVGQTSVSKDFGASWKSAQDQAGIKGCPLWRSTTGKAEGPYEIHTWITYSSPHLFEDDDGSVYMLDGVNRICKFNDDMTAYDEEWAARLHDERGFRGVLMQKEGLNMDYDIGISLIKVGGKYIAFTTNCIGGYDYQYWVSEGDIVGPYSRGRVSMPYGGHVGVFKDKEGKWQHVQYHMGMAPWVHELHVEDTGDDVLIMPKWEYEYQQERAEQ
ncbi:MAG: family 43 glycosylhydrolase [bacterium]